MLRGRFVPAGGWRTEAMSRSGATAACSRASTASRSTGCAREIEPATAADFMRFLLRWQHVRPGRAAARARRRVAR